MSTYMQKSTLVILAAGMGSRYGGLKQMDSFGPNGEAIIDYSIYDAIEAGFSKIVFIIRDSFRDDFIEFFSGKFEDKVEVAFVTQELSHIPEQFTLNPDRDKPWGTAHAVQMAKDEVEGPFAVINADDYYGKEAYQTIMDFFHSSKSIDNEYCIVGYFLERTLSDYGTVNRGVCSVDSEGFLDSIVECTKIKREEDGIIRFPQDQDERKSLDARSIVSMNMFGFGKSYFEHFDHHFTEFLQNHGQELKSEFYIPTLLDILIKSQEVKLKVLESESDWFGVTYQDDKPYVIKKLNEMISSGRYPEKLWT